MSNQDLISKRQFVRYLNSQPFFVWNQIKDQIEVDEDDFDFWAYTDIEEAPSNVAQVMAKTFGKIKQVAEELIMSRYDYIIIKGDVEQKIKMTKDLIDSGKVLIGPVFEYQGALSKPLAFDTKDKIIMNIKFSKKTKRRDIVDGYYDYSIIVKTTIVKKYGNWQPENKDSYLKGEISLKFIDVVHSTVSGDVPYATNKKGEVKDHDYLNYFKTQLIKKNKNGDDVMLPNFDDALKGIESAREAKEPTFEKLNLDVRNFGANPDWDKLLSHLGIEWEGFNGKVVAKTKVINDSVLEDDNPVLSQYRSIESAKVLNPNIPQYHSIKAAKTVMWYDFEGFSLPFSPLDGVSPYQQLVFQVSTIVTENNKEVYKKNLVIDPSILELKDLYSIIEEVYHGGVDIYVVYNKGYEIPRMREICNLLHGTKMFDSAVAMVDEIEEKTVDLMLVFKIGSKNILPNIILHDQKTKASIKNVEKHITYNKIDLPRPITPYKELAVQNGGMAMEEAIKRSLGITGNNEWEQVETALKKYCENDVRAMIMVYDFIEKLI